MIRPVVRLFSTVKNSLFRELGIGRESGVNQTLMEEKICCWFCFYPNFYMGSANLSQVILLEIWSV